MNGERQVSDGDLTTRLVVGTVQLGLPYGRHRTSPVMPEAAAFRILDAAWSLGIRAFDTAEAYGSSSARLRAWSEARGNADSLEVVTKCRVDFPGQPLQALEESAHRALARFDGIRRLVLLTHGSVGADRWPVLLAASAAHHAVIGQSVYSADEVRAACELTGVERLQVPGNVLDHRAIRARGSSPVSLDVRSVYLQGVLLEDPQHAELRVPGSAGIAAAIQSAASALETSVAPLLVASMLSVIAPGDRLVIGVHDVAELGVLPAAFEIPADTVKRFKEEIRYLSEDPALAFVLDPRRWSAQLVG
jgi:aryl-alcohol dehydrogenase-like predicted oxidoreductase